MQQEASFNSEQTIKNYSQKELNSFFLEDVFERSLKKANEPLFKRIFKNPLFNISLVASIIFSLNFINILPIRELAYTYAELNTDSEIHIIMMLVSFALMIISIFYTKVNQSAHTNEMHSFFRDNLNIRDPDDISTLDGLLVLIATISESNYSDVLKNVNKNEFISIRSRGRIKESEEDKIRDSYWILVRSLIADISIKNGVSSGVSVYRTEEQSYNDISRQIQNRQESFIRSFIINKKD